MLPEPEALPCTRYVGKLGAYLAAIDFFQQCINVTQFHAPVAGPGQAAGEVFLLHIRFGQAEIIELEHTRDRSVLQLQGIQIGYLMSAQAVHLNKAGYGRLFFLGGGNTCRLNGCRLAVSFACSCSFQEALADGRVGNFRLPVTQRPEISPPALGNGIRICHELLIERFDRGRVAAEQWRRRILVF